jgi:outer membrane protein
MSLQVNSLDSKKVRCFEICFLLFELFMWKKHRYFILMCIMGCKPPPEVSPSKYAPQSASTIWINSPKDERKLSHTLLKTIDPYKSSDSAALHLLDLFQIGLVNNPQTQKTFFDSQIAAAAYGSSRSALYPNIKFDFMALREKQGFVFINNEVLNIYTTTVGPEGLLSYNLIDFTRTPNIDQYFFELLSRNWTHNQQIQELLKNICNSYYNYLYQKSLLEAFNSDLIDAQATYTASKEKFEIGINDMTDLMQAKSRFLQKKINVTSQEAVVKNSLVSLSTILGISGQSDLNVLGFPDPKTIEANFYNAQELLDVAQQARADLRSLKAQIQQRKAEIKKAQGNRYPLVDLKGSFGQFWFNGGVTDNGNWSVQLDVTIPIFTGYDLVNKVRQAQAALKQSQSVLEQLQLQIISEVMKAYNDLLSAQQQLIYTGQYLEASQIDYKGAYEGYITGTKDILDVLNAQASLSDARAKQAEAIRSYFDAKANLTFAIGTMNKNEAP